MYAQRHVRINGESYLALEWWDTTRQEVEDVWLLPAERAQGFFKSRMNLCSNLEQS